MRWDYPSARTVKGALCARLVSLFPSSRWEDWQSVHLCCFGGAVTRLLEHSRVTPSDALGGLSDSFLHFLKLSFTTACIWVCLALHCLSRSLDHFPWCVRRRAQHLVPRSLRSDPNASSRRRGDRRLADSETWAPSGLIS
jgi:hypothetical protein